MTAAPLPSRRRVLPLVLVAALVAGALPAAAGTLDDILERGSVRVGVAEFAPWTLRNADDALVGFEIDLATRLAEDIGVQPEFKVYAWEAIIPALQAGEIDVIAGGMAITPARALAVNFSRPVANSGVGLVTHTELTSELASLNELDTPDKVVLTVRDTMGHSVAKRLFSHAKLRALKSAASAEQQLLAGRAHAYVTSLPEARFLALRHGDVVDLPIDAPLVAQSEALAVRKGDQEWLNFLDAWVTARSADKWIATTRDYWFGTLDWAAGARAAE